MAKLILYIFMMYDTISGMSLLIYDTTAGMIWIMYEYDTTADMSLLI